MNVDVCVLCLPVCVHLCAKNNNKKNGDKQERSGQSKGAEGGSDSEGEKGEGELVHVWEETQAIRFIFTVLKNMLSGGNVVTTCLEYTHPLFQVVIGLVRNLRHDHQGSCSSNRETNKQTNKKPWRFSKIQAPTVNINGPFLQVYLACLHIL